MGNSISSLHASISESSAPAQLQSFFTDYVKEPWRSERSKELDALGGLNRPAIARGNSMTAKLQFLEEHLQRQQREMTEVLHAKPVSSLTVNVLDEGMLNSTSPYVLWTGVRAEVRKQAALRSAALEATEDSGSGTSALPRWGSQDPSEQQQKRQQQLLRARMLEFAKSIRPSAAPQPDKVDDSSPGPASPSKLASMARSPSPVRRSFTRSRTAEPNLLKSKASIIELAQWRIRIHTSRRRVLLTVLCVVRLQRGAMKSNRLQRMDSFGWVLPVALGPDLPRFIEEMEACKEAESCIEEIQAKIQAMARPPVSPAHTSAASHATRPTSAVNRNVNMTPTGRQASRATAEGGSLGAVLRSEPSTSCALRPTIRSTSTSADAGARHHLKHSTPVTTKDVARSSVRLRKSTHMRKSASYPDMQSPIMDNKNSTAGVQALQYDMDALQISLSRGVADGGQSDILPEGLDVDSGLGMIGPGSGSVMNTLPQVSSFLPPRPTTKPPALHIGKPKQLVVSSNDEQSDDSGNVSRAKMKRKGRRRTGNNSDSSANASMDNSDHVKGSSSPSAAAGSAAAAPAAGSHTKDCSDSLKSKSPSTATGGGSHKTWSSVWPQPLGAGTPGNTISKPRGIDHHHPHPHPHGVKMSKKAAARQELMRAAQAHAAAQARSAGMMSMYLNRVNGSWAESVNWSTQPAPLVSPDQLQAFRDSDQFMVYRADLIRRLRLGQIAWFINAEDTLLPSSSSSMSQYVKRPSNRDCAAGHIPGTPLWCSDPWQLLATLRPGSLPMCNRLEGVSLGGRALTVLTAAVEGLAGPSAVNNINIIIQVPAGHRDTVLQDLTSHRMYGLNPDRVYVLESPPRPSYVWNATNQSFTRSAAPCPVSMTNRSTARTPNTSVSGAQHAPSSTRCTTVNHSAGQLEAAHALVQPWCEALSEFEGLVKQDMDLQQAQLGAHAVINNQDRQMPSAFQLQGAGTNHHFDSQHGAMVTGELQGQQGSSSTMHCTTLCQQTSGTAFGLLQCSWPEEAVQPPSALQSAQGTQVPSVAGAGAGHQQLPSGTAQYQPIRHARSFAGSIAIENSASNTVINANNSAASVTMPLIRATASDAGTRHTPGMNNGNARVTLKSVWEELQGRNVDWLMSFRGRDLALLGRDSGMLDVVTMAYTLSMHNKSQINMVISGVHASQVQARQADSVILQQQLHSTGSSSNAVPGASQHSDATSDEAKPALTLPPRPSSSKKPATAEKRSGKKSKQCKGNSRLVELRPCELAGGSQIAELQRNWLTVTSGKDHGHHDQSSSSSVYQKGAPVTVGLQRYMFHVPTLAKTLSQPQTFRPKLQLCGGGASLAVTYELSDITAAPGVKTLAVSSHHHTSTQGLSISQRSGSSSGCSVSDASDHGVPCAITQQLPILHSAADLDLMVPLLIKQDSSSLLRKWACLAGGRLVYGTLPPCADPTYTPGPPQLHSGPSGDIHTSHLLGTSKSVLLKSSTSLNISTTRNSDTAASTVQGMQPGSSSGSSMVTVSSRPSSISSILDHSLHYGLSNKAPTDASGVRDVEDESQQYPELLKLQQSQVLTVQGGSRLHEDYVHRWVVDSEDDVGSLGPFAHVKGLLHDHIVDSALAGVASFDSGRRMGRAVHGQRILVFVINNNLAQTAVNLAAALYRPGADRVYLVTIAASPEHQGQGMALCQAYVDQLSSQRIVADCRVLVRSNSRGLLDCMEQAVQECQADLVIMASKALTSGAHVDLRSSWSARLPPRSPSPSLQLPTSISTSSSATSAGGMSRSSLGGVPDALTSPVTSRQVLGSVTLSAVRRLDVPVAIVTANTKNLSSHLQRPILTAMAMVESHARPMLRYLTSRCMDPLRGDRLIMLQQVSSLVNRTLQQATVQRRLLESFVDIASELHMPSDKYVINNDPHSRELSDLLTSEGVQLLGLQVSPASGRILPAHVLQLLAKSHAAVLLYKEAS